jgi:hypothetical protein
LGYVEVQAVATPTMTLQDRNRLGGCGDERAVGVEAPTQIDHADSSGSASGQGDPGRGHAGRGRY